MIRNPFPRAASKCRLAPSVALAGVLAVAGVSAACGPSSHEKKPAAVPGVPVKSAVVLVEPIGQPFEVGGEVRARETAAITSRIVAQVEQVRVTPGDRVRAGQVLVLLDGRDLEAGRARAQAAVVTAEQSAQRASAERRAAEASLALASAMHKRVSDLRAKNSATASEMDEADAALRAAQARLDAVNAQAAEAAAGIDLARAAARGAVVSASYATLTAPFHGVVTQKLVDAGNMASPGAVLLTVEDTRAFRLEVRVDESRASLVTAGRSAEVLLDNAPALTARVSEIARVLEPGAHAFLAKLDLPSVPGLRSGMFGRARFAGPARQALTVPDRSIVRRGQLTSVFVVDAQGTAHLRLVSVGEAAGERAEIRAGLDAGEAVVIDPPPALVDGAPVRRLAADRAGVSSSAPDGGRR